MKRYLVLENGTVFSGEAFGADRDVIAEIVFNTSIVGYVEILTDVAYKGQAVCQTFPLSGNYGVCLEDAETEGIGVSALIVREYAEIPSNFRSHMSLDAYMKENGIPGLCGIDTRALTKLLRENGSMNGAITSDPAKVDMEALKSYKTPAPAAALSTKETYTVNPEGKYTVALYDLGRKNSIVKELTARDCKVVLLPWNTDAETVKALSPDALFLSAGPGSPDECSETIEAVCGLMGEKIPTMGIGLGHLVLAKANGFAAEKLAYGHHGGQPVRDVKENKLYITSQNHCWTVQPASVDPAIAETWYVNVNDGSVEGLRYENTPAISIQFQPTESGGPRDTGFLYDTFMDMVKANKN